MSADDLNRPITWQELRDAATTRPLSTWRGKAMFRARTRARAGLMASVPRPAPMRIPVGGLAMAATFVLVVALTAIRHDPMPATPAPVAGGVAEAAQLPVRVVKVASGQGSFVDDGVRLEWDGDASATYQVSRCFIAPGLEACEDVVRTRGSSFEDRRPTPPADVVFYRVRPVDATAPEPDHQG